MSRLRSIAAAIRALKGKHTHFASAHESRQTGACLNQLEQSQVYFSLPYVKELRSATLSRVLTFAVAVLLDCISIQFGTLLGVLAYVQLRHFNWEHSYVSVLEFSLEYVLIFVFFSYKRELYKHAHSLLEIRETAEILRVNTLCLALVALSIYLHRLMVPRLMLLFCWAITTILLLMQKHLTRQLIVQWKSRHVQRRNVVIIGSDKDARRIFSILTKSPDLGLCPVAFLDENETDANQVIFSHDYHFRHSAPVLAEPLSDDLLRRLKVAEIYVSQTTVSDARLSDLIAFAKLHTVPISFIGNKGVADATHPADVRFLDGLHISTHMVSERPDLLYIGAKRVFDVLVALILLLFTAPIWAIIAIWIRLSSPGPVFFRQQRVAKEGRPFGIYKFRSMYVTAPKYGTSPDQAFDPRVTPAGRFLRKSSLDELPQLLNVLMGDMSLVGPRPEMPFIVRDYTPVEHQRLLVPQGMTGFWQLSADRKFAIHERLEYDLYYLEQKGFFFDLAILVHTAFFAMKGI